MSPRSPRRLDFDVLEEVLVELLEVLAEVEEELEEEQLEEEQLLLLLEHDVPNC